MDPEKKQHIINILVIIVLLVAFFVIVYIYYINTSINCEVGYFYNFSLKRCTRCIVCANDAQPTYICTGKTLSNSHCVPLNIISECAMEVTTFNSIYMISQHGYYLQDILPPALVISNNMLYVIMFIPLLAYSNMEFNHQYKFSFNTSVDDEEYIYFINPNKEDEYKFRIMTKNNALPLETNLMIHMQILPITNRDIFLNLTFKIAKRKLKVVRKSGIISQKFTEILTVGDDLNRNTLILTIQYNCFLPHPIMELYNANENYMMYSNGYKDTFCSVKFAHPGGDSDVFPPETYEYRILLSFNGDGRYNSRY